MIRYRITKAALFRSIAAEDRRQNRRKGWLVRSGEKRAAMKKEKKFVNGGSIWGDIKQVYMELQKFKCGFCERKLPLGIGANYEHDVEHFRPKQKVEVWADDGFPGATGGALDRGYYWLAYEPFNYVTTCRICNSAFKKNFFPIDGVRGAAFATIGALNRGEKPLLIYPIGTVDQDPERLISFQGITAVALAAGGRSQRRALVCICLFALNLRDDLLLERFLVIERLWEQFERRETGTSQARKDAEEVIQRLTSAGFGHTNCARAFVRLFERDPEAAFRYYDSAKGILREKALL